MLQSDVWAHGHKPIELYGSKGSLRVPDPNHFGDNVETTFEHEDWVLHGTSSMPMGAQNWPLNAHGRANYRGAGVAELASHIRIGTPHRSSGGLALHSLEIMLAIVNGDPDSGPVDILTKIEQPAKLSEEDAQSLFAN